MKEENCTYLTKASGKEKGLKDSLIGRPEEDTSFFTLIVSRFANLIPGQKGAVATTIFDWTAITMA